MSIYERSALLPSRSLTPEYREQPKTIAGSSTSEEWNSTYSSSSSLYCSDESDDDYTPDWDAFVRNDGSLFYIEYDTVPTAATNRVNKQNILPDSNAVALNQFNRASTRRSKKSSSKLSKMINRRVPQSKGKVPATVTQPSNASAGGGINESAKVKFREIAEGEVKEIRVFIDPSMRHKYGRRASVSEAILGVSICPFADGKRIMIASYMPNSSLGQDKFVKVGDWLKAINDEEVSVDSIDLMLLGYGKPTEVKLTLQRMSGEEQVTQQASVLTKISSVHELEAALCDGANDLDGRLIVMYLTMSELDEHGAEGQDVRFCYPPKDSNDLYACRGSFLTLNSLLKIAYQSTPVATTVHCNSVDYHVVYKAFNDDLLLVAIASTNATLTEAKLKATEIMRCIEFQQQTVSAALFSSHTSDHWHEVFAIVSRLSSSAAKLNAVAFESALPEPHHVPLPKEAQLRIDDALGEMEAMDYREWNDEPLKSHREFYIIGSALFYLNYMLASHLPPADLIDIEAYLRMHGVLSVLGTQSVRDLVIWQEVYPKSVERGMSESYGIPKGRWFLAVIARSHMLLAVLLESRHDGSSKAGSDIRPIITPSPFYIEEIQDTFEHLKTGGIENLASTWIQSNKRPQILKETPSSTIPPTVKKTEIISILKRRNNSSENLAIIGGVGDNSGSGGGSKLTVVTSTSVGGGSSVNSQTLSEDSNHDESDSDWDGFPDSQRSGSGFDIADVTETLLREVSDVLPSKITAGLENVLVHYVQIEVGQGILLAPTGLASDDPVIRAFRKTALLIHTILQNTIRFRHLLALESSTPSSHRSLVAIKEHGVLISVDSGAGPMDFWVIGRLFTSPPKELYVCHRADVPQNLLEMTFRLSLNSAG